MSNTRPLPKASVTPIKRATFSDQIVAKLRRDIISGDIAGGTQITESSLAAEFQVSRGPLREAMAQLAVEGLIVSVPFTGTHVFKLTVSDVRELYSLRTALETLAFRELWAKRDDAFAGELAARHARLLATLELGDRAASSEAEVNFHSLVYEACGHKLLLESWQRIAGRLQLYLALHQQAHGRTGPIGDAHEAYLRLALGNRLDLMVEEIERHMQRGLGQLETYVGV